MAYSSACFFFVWLLFQVSLVKNSHREDKRIKAIKKLEEIDKLKGYKNGSIVLFFESQSPATKRLEQTLIRANDHMGQYGFKLRKLDCKKFVSVRECRVVDEPVAYTFMRGEQKIFDETDLNGTDLTVNQILFFMANAHHEKMIDCANMDQAKELIEISSTILNTVLGSFQRKDSEYFRRYLEVIMDMGKQIAFILMSGNQVDKSMYNKHGFFIRFYYTFKSVNGEEAKFVDISGNARTKLDLKATIVGLNIEDELKTHTHNIQEAKQNEKDAGRKHEEMIEDIKEKAMSDLHRKMTAQENRIEKQKSSKKTKKLSEGLGPTLHIPEGLSEISEDAYEYYMKNAHIPKDRSGYLLNEDELRKAISNNEQTNDQLLLVLFYVPWDATYQIFEKTYHFLSDKYQNNPNVNLVQFDCWAWLTVCNQYKLISYPKILVFRNGMKAFEYKGFLQADTIAKHITLWKEPFLPQLSDVKQVEEITQKMKSMFLMGIFTNNSKLIDVRQKEFERIALEHYGNIRIGITVVKEEEIIFRKGNYTLPVVFSVNSNEMKGRITHTSDFNTNALNSWIQDQKRKEVEQLSFSNYPSLVMIKKPFLISFQEKYKDLSSLHKLAKRFSELITVWMDEDCPLSVNLMETYKLQSNGSKLILFDKTKNAIFEYNNGKKTIGNVAKWIKAYLSDMKESATYILPEVKDIINEGYDFFNMTDKVKRNETDEARELNGRDPGMRSHAPYISRGRINIKSYVEAVMKGITEEDEDEEDEEFVSQHYNNLHFQAELNERDEL